LIKAMVANVLAAIAYVKRAAEQLPKFDYWQALVRYIGDKITGTKCAARLPAGGFGYRVTAVFRLKRRQIKLKDSFSSLGVNRSDTRRCREDLQRQLGNEDTILCKRFSETKY
jgi:hypothetical protein